MTTILVEGTDTIDEVTRETPADISVNAAEVHDEVPLIIGKDSPFLSRILMCGSKADNPLHVHTILKEDHTQRKRHVYTYICTSIAVMGGVALIVLLSKLT